MQSKFHLRYFLTRVALAALCALGIANFISYFILQERTVEAFHKVDAATTDPVLAEKAVREYWQKHYDPNLVMKRSKYYIRGKLISETKHYMDGRVITEGMSTFERRAYAIIELLVLFALVYLAIPIFYRKPLHSALKLPA